jgi:hypothetical protein
MRIPIAATLAVVLLTTPAAAMAQDAAAVPPQIHDGQQQPAQLPQPADPPSAAQLGLSLDRIRQELREAPATDSQLRYDFHVEVYGTNPKVDFFKDFDLSPRGPVRYGGMTHAEFLSVVTPQAYSAPTADLLGLAMFAIQQLGKRAGGGSKE